MIRHIVFRCLHCRGTTSVQAEWTRRDQPAEVVCVDCNAAYELPARRDRGASNRDYYERARKFATDNGIDLPSAYSVFEGILPREKVRALAKPAQDAVPAASTPLRSLALFAAMVVGLAYLGSHFRERLSPKPVLARSAATQAAVRFGPQRANRRPAAVARESAVASYVPVVLQTNAAGAVTRVAGPDPKNVLAAYCQQPGVAGRLTVVGVSQTTPPSSGVRLGVLRPMDEPEALYTVKIWLDAVTGRWTIGNGLEPIRNDPAELHTSALSPQAPDTASAALASRK